MQLICSTSAVQDGGRWDMSQEEARMTAGLSMVDRDGVVVVTMDRPPANALNGALIHDLAELFTELATKSDAPPLVLTGRGVRFFSAGGDIKELDGARPQDIEVRMREFHALLVAMERYPRPVVAAVNGHCVGGGMEIALFADAVFAVASARFGFPEINHGLLPADKGVQRATRLLGMRATRQILLSGDLFDAGHALDIQLVEELVPAVDLLDTAIEAARTAGAKAPVLYAALKRSVNGPDQARDAASLNQTLACAADYFDDPVARRLRDGWSGDRPRRDEENGTASHTRSAGADHS